MTLWRSLRARLVLSHLLVALVSGLVIVVVVRLVALQRWDRVMGGGEGMGRRHGADGPAGMPAFRAEFVDSVDQAVIAGVMVGLIVAMVLGVLAARRTARPLEELRTATDQLALGRYDVQVPSQTTTELASLADDVQRLAERLHETEARRARLIGEVAHEMRTPLTVTRGYAEAMLDGVVPADRDGLGRIVHQTRRLERLAEDLSSLSRAEEGRLDVRMTDADLATTVLGAVSAFQDRAQALGVRVELDSPESLVVPHDPDRIAQVLTNLLANALRASHPDGQIEVRVTQSATGGTTGDDGAPPDSVLVEVTDHGVGLRAGEEAAVFERFYRGGAAATGAGGEDGDSSRVLGGGSGIGLTIARALARAHGGELDASSPGPGRGARFSLRLPARPTGPTYAD